MKICRGCKKEKDESEYYRDRPKHKTIYCKRCSSLISRKAYVKNRKQRLAYFKNRFKQNKKTIVARRSVIDDHIKLAVNAKLRYAVRTGKVKKLPCEVCGNKNSQGHHPDYSKPLEVLWLCDKHHKEHHRKYI